MAPVLRNWFAEILAGNRAGITTIMVDAIHPEEERWFTRVKRGPEKWLLQRLEKQGKIRHFI